MLSNDENIEKIADIVEEAKQWIIIKKEYAKLDVIEKVVRILSTLTIAFIIALLTLMALIYISFSAAYFLADVFHSTPLAFLTVGIAYILLLLLMMAKRHTWIERPIVRFLISIFKEESTNK
ncbi:MAG: phage holin family protein [Prevotellaceae bacterium]|nr:phage holin family protein [Prevotellaceae bacterium]MDO4931377.1 phage holin family protein [Prevotellaceae bacterium]